MRRSVPGRRFTGASLRFSPWESFLPPPLELTQIRAMVYSLLLGILLILTVPRQAGAQATAQLRGTVVDPLGAAVSGASVRLTNLLTGFERRTATPVRWLLPGSQRSLPDL